MLTSKCLVISNIGTTQLYVYACYDMPTCNKRPFLMCATLCELHVGDVQIVDPCMRVPNILFCCWGLSAIANSPSKCVLLASAFYLYFCVWRFYFITNAYASTFCFACCFFFLWASCVTCWWYYTIPSFIAAILWIADAQSVVVAHVLWLNTAIA